MLFAIRERIALPVITNKILQSRLKVFLIMKANEMHYFSDLFCKILYKYFGHVHCPSSGVSQHGIHAIGTCHSSSAGVCQRGHPDYASSYCVYTMLKYSWWWTVGMSETCRVLYKINLRNNASRWLLLQKYITIHGPLNVKFKIFHFFSCRWRGFESTHKQFLL